MKLYIWLNDNTDSDFIPSGTSNFDFGFHSGALVIIAENTEEAEKIAQKEHGIKTKPIEIDMSKKGIVIYAGGEC